MATSDWAKNRQIMYGGGVFLFLFVIIAPIVFFLVYESPSCFDGKRNQGESSIDRGGPCQLLDERSIQPQAVLWARSFPVRDGSYNAVAYIENPNQEAGVYDVAYQFKLYDDRNILIAERFGRVPIFPGKVFPIFESRIDTGNRVPVRTFFSFVSDLTWERMSDPTLGVSVINEKLNGEDTSPRIDASVRNNTVSTKEDIVIIATVFDRAGNAINSSRTLVDRIAPNTEIPIAFTWPSPFPTDVTRIDLVPLALPKRTQ
tara:strand:- start:6138 stop:6914 length:777 start_codon:yes stop_codon:yes gene_type:complete